MAITVASPSIGGGGGLKFKEIRSVSPGEKLTVPKGEVWLVTGYLREEVIRFYPSQEEVTDEFYSNLKPLYLYEGTPCESGTYDGVAKSKIFVYTIT